ncbi:MAG: Holliday junction branch migration protein RuvA, partial [Burkholderiales bacterium]
DKLAGGAAVSVDGAAAQRSDAMHALLALGYSQKEASAALAKVAGNTALPESIRQALKLLSKSS